MSFRDRLSKGFLLAAYWAAPSHMRSILGHVAKSVEGVAEEIEAGRDGGVMITPWFRSEAGAALAHTQALHCVETAGHIRALHEARARESGKA